MSNQPAYIMFSSGLRPGASGINNHFSFWRVIIIVVIVAFFLYWLLIEALDYYPGDDPILKEAGNPDRFSLIKKLKEGFIGVKVASSLVNVPQPGNIELNPDLDIINETTPMYPLNDNSFKTKKIDTDILRSQRYYDSLYQPLLSDNKLTKSSGPLFRIPSLQQEIPSTYMINNLNIIRDTQPDFEIPKSSLKYKIHTELLQYQPDGNKYYYKTPLYTFANLGKLKSYQLDNEPLFLELFTLLKLYVITKINLQVLENKQSPLPHKFKFFNIIQSQHLKLELDTIDTDTDTDTNIKQSPLLFAIFNIIIHREYKPYTFNIQAKIEIDLFSDINIIKAQIIDLELIGSTMDGNIEAPLLSRLENPLGVNLSKTVGNGGTVNAPITDTRVSIPGMDIASSNYDILNIKANKNFIDLYSNNENGNENGNENENENDNIRIQEARYKDTIGFMDSISKEYADTYKNQRRDKINELYPSSSMKIYDMQTSGSIENTEYTPNIYGDYKCFQYDFDKMESIIDTDSLDPIKCKSYNQKYKKNGVWDTKCTEDTDCPFYKPDAFPNEVNYGCDRIVPIMDNKGNIIDNETGYCSMPDNKFPIGYRKYLKPDIIPSVASPLPPLYVMK